MFARRQARQFATGPERTQDQREGHNGAGG